MGTLVWAGHLQNTTEGWEQVHPPRDGPGQKRRTRARHAGHYGRTVNLESQLGLLLVVNIAVGILATVVGLLLMYLVIRQGVFHGLRAHTRWVDNGKDYEKIR